LVLNLERKERCRTAREAGNGIKPRVITGKQIAPRSQARETGDGDGRQTEFLPRVPLRFTLDFMPSPGPLASSKRMDSRPLAQVGSSPALNHIR